jgi:hypothetical protein
MVLTLAVVTRPTSETVKKYFYSAEHLAEDILMDPLILNADL